MSNRKNNVDAKGSLPSKKHCFVLNIYLMKKCTRLADLMSLCAHDTIMMIVKEVNLTMQFSAI